MNNSDLSDYKIFFKSNLLLISILLFVVIYVILNYNQINSNGIFTGDFVKSILITAIVVLLLYLFTTWDDESINKNFKYKIVNDNQSGFGNKQHIIGGKKPGFTGEVSAERILAGFEEMKLRRISGNKYNMSDINKKTNLTNNIDNNSIFLPHKSITKFGLKF